MQSERHLITTTLQRTVVEFFEAYGMVCEQDSAVAERTGPKLGSIVGFRGKALHGGLAFVTSADLIAKMLPVPKRPARAELQLRDWSAEIANQLVGRLKNKLSPHAIDFEVGSPVCFRGSSVRLSFLPEADGVNLDFAAGDDVVKVFLDCALAESEAARSPPVASRIVTEGEVILF